MKLLLYTDVHFSATSSIITQQGKTYTKRLETLIDSLNWAESLEHDAVVCLGDFFDRANLTAQEITALSEVNWSNKEHYFVLGNHEMNGSYHSLNALRLLGFHIIDKPLEKDGLCFLPYTHGYKKIKDVFNNPKIVFSHNDVAGVQLLGTTMKNGFNLKDIQTNCELFLNGHIHKYSKDKNFINLGSFCGQNFGDTDNPHRAYMLDTETLELKAYDNPHSFHFRKYDFSKGITKVDIPTNAVASVTCREKDAEKVKAMFETVKLNIIPEKAEVELEEVVHIDHVQALRDYFEKSENIVKEELSIIVGGS